MRYGQPSSALPPLGYYPDKPVDFQRNTCTERKDMLVIDEISDYINYLGLCRQTLSSARSILRNPSANISVSTPIPIRR